MNRFVLSLSAVAVLALAGCTTARSGRTHGQYMDDKAVTSRVKYKLSQSPTVSAFDLQVNTFEGVVQLSGFVEYDIQSRTAEEIATSVPEVREVRNSIQVRRETPSQPPRASVRAVP